MLTVCMGGLGNCTAKAPDTEGHVVFRTGKSRDRKWISGRQGLEREMGMMANGYESSFGGDGVF